MDSESANLNFASTVTVDCVVILGFTLYTKSPIIDHNLHIVDTMGDVALFGFVMIKIFQHP